MTLLSPLVNKVGGEEYALVLPAAPHHRSTHEVKYASWVCLEVSVHGQG